MVSLRGLLGLGLVMLGGVMLGVDSVAIAAPFTSMPRLSGFSADGRHYIHLESSRDTGSGIPASRLQVVAMADNRCVAQSCLATRYAEAQASVSLAQTELDLLQKTWTLRQALQLAVPQAGQTVQVLSRSRTADGTEILTLKLAEREQSLELHLHQFHNPSRNPRDVQKTTTQRHTFALELIHDGQRQQVDIVDRFQAQGLDYSIREVKLSPRGDRLAVLLTATLPTFEGTLATTLVQGFEL